MQEIKSKVKCSKSVWRQREKSPKRDSVNVFLM